MKKAPKKAARAVADDKVLPEYDFSRATRGTHARPADLRAVTIDPEVWAVFPRARAINDALRAAARIVKQARSATAVPHSQNGTLLMDLQPLECVALTRDVPEHNLKAGDLGSIVETYEPDGVDVEFVTAAGRTQTLITLRASDVRKVAPTT